MFLEGRSSECVRYCGYEVNMLVCSSAAPDPGNHPRPAARFSHPSSSQPGPGDNYGIINVWTGTLNSILSPGINNLFDLVLIWSNSRYFTPSNQDIALHKRLICVSMRQQNLPYWELLKASLARGTKRILDRAKIDELKISGLVSHCQINNCR